MSWPDHFTCEEMFRKLDAYLDRTLSDQELALVESHLEECARCAGEYRFEQHVVDDIRGKLRRIDLPSDLASRISARLASDDESAREDR